MTQGMHVRLRREDQNRVLGKPAHAFSQPYYFPTVDAACTFAIRSAGDGWDVELPGGIILSRTNNNEEGTVAGKSLRGSTGKSLRPTAGAKSLKPSSAVRRTLPVFADVPDGTDWVSNGGGYHVVTKMPDGVEIAWTNCGVCSQFVLNCQCSRGITAPNGVKYIYNKVVGVLAGAKWDDVPMPSRSGDSSRERTSFVHPWREGRPTVTKSLRPYQPAKPEGKSLRKPAEAPQGKSLRRPTVVIDDNFDLGEVDRAAEQHAADLTQQLAKSLSRYRKG